MTGTDLTQPVTVVSPRTGELLSLDSADDQLAGFLADVREYESLLREAKRFVSSELLRRMDENASWTMRAGELVVKGASPAPAEEFDEIALRADLWRLVDENVITETAANAAVETVVTYKTKRAGIAALRKLGGRVATIIDRHSRLVEKDRRVTVSRA